MLPNHPSNGNTHSNSNSDGFMQAMAAVERLRTGALDTCSQDELEFSFAALTDDNLNPNLDREEFLPGARYFWNKPIYRLKLQERQELWARDRRETFKHLMESHTETEAAASGGGIVLSDMQARKPRWLFAPYLRPGKLQTLEGKKGVGKSTITLWLAKQVLERNAQGRVLIFTPPAEGDAAEDILPRALAAGVDTSRIIVYPKPITFAETERLHDLIQQHGAVLVVFDTFQRYIPNSSANMNDTHASQGQINPLETVASETDCSVLLIRHQRKGAVADATEAGIGSQGIAGAARTVIVAGKHPDESQRAQGKYALSIAAGNYSATGGALIYTLLKTTIPTPAGPMETTFANIEDEDASIEASDITGYAGDATRNDQSALNWLLKTLNDGPMTSQELKKAAEEDGFSWRTMQRIFPANNHLIKSGKSGDPSTPYRNRKWTYSLITSPYIEKWRSNGGQTAETRIDTSDELLRQPLKSITSPSENEPLGEVMDLTTTDSNTCFHQQAKPTPENPSIWVCPDCGKMRNGDAGIWSTPVRLKASGQAVVGGDNAPPTIRKRSNGHRRSETRRAGK